MEGVKINKAMQNQTARALLSQADENTREKAKQKRDGVYSYKGYLYAVKNKRFVAFSNFHGECFQRCGAFNVNVGKVNRTNRKKALKQFTE